jgi:hypothetical protein
MKWMSGGTKRPCDRALASPSPSPRPRCTSCGSPACEAAARTAIRRRGRVGESRASPCATRPIEIERSASSPPSASVPSPTWSQRERRVSGGQPGRSRPLYQTFLCRTGLQHKIYCFSRLETARPLATGSWPLWAGGWPGRRVVRSRRVAELIRRRGRPGQ